MTSLLEPPGWHTTSIPPVSVAIAAAQEWLDAYVAAWKTYDERQIADLWSEAAVWHYPFQTRASGRDEIVAEWLSERDAFVGESSTPSTIRSSFRATGSSPMAELSFTSRALMA